MLRNAGSLALVVALILLVSGAAQAMPLAGPARPSESRGIVDRFWGWLETLFQIPDPFSGQVQSVWEEEGSHADPNGIS